MTDCTLLGLEFQSPDLVFYKNRVKTFDSWSTQIHPNKFRLSSAGFFYTGRSDIVECFSCAIRLHKWKEDDNPLKEHMLVSPNCLFLKIIGQENSSDDQAYKTFNSLWNPWSSINSVTGFQDGGDPELIDLKKI